MRRALSSVLLLGCAACAPAAVSPAAAPDAPERVLARAIEQAGGATALERATALLWEGEATVHAGGRTVSIAGRWAVQPPDTAVVSTWEASRGPESVRHLVVAQPRGWTVRGGAFTPMPAAMLASEREEFYLYSVMRLVPLRDPGVALTAIPADSLGQRGIRASRAGRPDAELFVDGAGRLAHIRMVLPDGYDGHPVRQDVWLDGSIEAEGVRWPRSIRITQDGAPFFDLALRSLGVRRTVSDPLLAGPR
jgi:hypothetical protein